MKRSSLRIYIALLVRTVPRETARSLVLMFLLSVTEGVGLLFLVPLLALAGIVPGATAGSGGWFTRVAAYLPHSLAAVLAAYVAIVALRAVIEIAAAATSAEVEGGLTRALRERLYRALVEARWDVVVRLKGSHMAHVLTAELDRVALATNQLLHGLLALFVAVTYALAALAISPQLALVAAGIALLLMLSGLALRRSATADGERLSELSAELFSGAIEQVATLKVAKSAGVAEVVATRFAERSARYGAQLVRVYWRWVAAGAVMNVGAAVALSVVVYVAVMQIHLAPARLLLLLFVCARLVPKAAMVQQSLLHTARAMPAAVEVRDLLTQLEAAADVPSGIHHPAPPFTRTLALEHVSYRYPNADRDALRDVSLHVPIGQVTAIVGLSGAGKSTIADMLLQLIVPERGAVTLDGIPLDASMQRDWRRHVGYVPQDPQLFHDSVRENLRWVAPQATDEEIMIALRMSGALPLLSRLEHGLDTLVGDRGALLSGGERQRIALARALLRRPSLLVLDEATSALDPESEQALRDAFSALTPTISVVTITHRLTSARLADHVVVMDAGEVVGEGSWDTLVQIPDSRLSTLWAAQLGDSVAGMTALPVALPMGVD